MISALNRLANANLELTITIPWEKVKLAYDKVLTKTASETTLKGFRKGKAPKKLVEQKANKNTLYEETLKLFLPEVYAQAVKEQKIKPVISPQLRVISTTEGKDWQIQAVTCELPDIKLGEYQSEIRKVTAADKIWVPGKEQKVKDKKENEEEKLAKIFKTLSETVKFQIPEILVQDEINRMLSRLIDQTAKVGLTIEQYLTSINKTIDQLKGEYRQQAEELLKIELILSAIADREDVFVSEEEINKLIQAVPDEKIKTSLNTPEQRLYLKQLLRKRKVIDNLSHL